MNPSIMPAACLSASIKIRRPIPPAAFAMPLITLVLLMIFAPALLTICMAFTEFNGLAPPRWSGLTNLVLVLRDPIFATALSNTVWFIALAVPLRIGVAWLAAMLLDGRSASGRRAGLLLPTLIPDAAYALAWTWIANPLYGPLNHALALFGIAGPGWLGELHSAPWVFVMMAVLQTGETFVVASAALRGSSPALIEAARLDGAGNIALLRWVHWPELRDWVGLTLARDTVLVMTWTLVPTQLMTGGDPIYSTMFLPLHAFRTSIDFLRFGDGALITLVMWSLTLLPISLGLHWGMRRAQN